METNTHAHYFRPYVTGLLLIVLSFGIYLLSDGPESGFLVFDQSFIFCYIISAAYLFILLINKVGFDEPRPSISQGCWINAVILFTISAFALNREMHVFARFPMWLNIYTLSCIPLFLVFPHYGRLPKAVQAVVLLLSGASLSLSAYMFLYLLPLLPLSMIALIALGISIHSFVPATWLLVLLNFILKKATHRRKGLLILTGALVPAFLLFVYVYKWQQLQTNIKDIIARQNIKLGNQLPDALYLAQQLPDDPLTEEILMAPHRSQRFWGDGMSLDRDGGNKYHNPLSLVASGLFGNIDLDTKSVEQFLNIRHDQRHSNTRKLWTGISLSTAAVSTNIQVFPQYRLAYHQKTIVIHNDPLKSSRDAWFVTPTQEALYTFHLPEGSIVTSLSLWINGREEQSRLSTLHKADSAYTNIVGVQRRDPAIVRWKEGNTVTVSIFPCTEVEDRKFKIGFTTPLKTTGNGLSLENIWFEGPDARAALEATQLILEGNAQVAGTVPQGFEKQANGSYLYEGDYTPYWQIALHKPALSANNFCFGGYSYSLHEARPQQLSLAVDKVFLDITKEWTKEEYDALVAQLASRKLYAWVPEKTKITKENKDLVWKSVSGNQFSLPFLYDIAQPEKAAVITKTPHQSPLLSDLEGSNTADAFTDYLATQKQPLQVLNIGTEHSPFWRSLHELRLVNYITCTKEQAVRSIMSGRFERFAEDSSCVVIADSKMAITKTPVADSLASGKAPDHLLRVFAYNDLLRQTGRNYFRKGQYEDALFREAEEGYVVSPVTSMIVLESQADYARMGIAQNSKTVGNATIAGGGAVPEPHEWLLIALVVFFILRHFYKKRQLAL